MVVVLWTVATTTSVTVSITKTRFSRGTAVVKATIAAATESVNDFILIIDVNAG